MVRALAIVEQIVFRVIDLTYVFEYNLLVEKYLTITKLPIPKRKHNYRRKFHDVQSLFVEIVAHDWWLSVEIGELVAFNDVQVDQSKKRDGKQDWHNESIGERDENKVHNRRIPKMQL